MTDDSATARPTHTLRVPMAAAMLGALCGVSISLGDGTSRRYRPSSYHCVTCNESIPPGKPGRKCKTCRKGTPNA